LVDVRKADALGEPLPLFDFPLSQSMCARPTRWASRFRFSIFLYLS
jgi:hypothetical protein